MKIWFTVKMKKWVNEGWNGKRGERGVKVGEEKEEGKGRL